MAHAAKNEKHPLVHEEDTHVANAARDEEDTPKANPAKNEKHPLVHVVNGKETTIGHMVHYTDAEHQTHAALIKHLDPETHEATLHVFHSDSNGLNHTQVHVAHSATPTPHTWNHLPTTK